MEFQRSLVLATCNSCVTLFSSLTQDCSLSRIMFPKPHAWVLWNGMTFNDQIGLYEQLLGGSMYSFCLVGQTWSKNQNNSLSLCAVCKGIPSTPSRCNLGCHFDTRCRTFNDTMDKVLLLEEESIYLFRIIFLNNYFLVLGYSSSCHIHGNRILRR